MKRASQVLKRGEMASTQSECGIDVSSGAKRFSRHGGVCHDVKDAGRDLSAQRHQDDGVVQPEDIKKQESRGKWDGDRPERLPRVRDAIPLLWWATASDSSMPGCCKVMVATTRTGS